MGNSDGYATRGAMVNFHQKANKVHFEINREAAAARPAIHPRPRKSAQIVPANRWVG
jgi:hypothetical protein